MDNGRDGENAILAALEAATLDLAARLRFGSFDLVSLQDEFVAGRGAAAFALSRGFLAGPPTVQAASDRCTLDTGARDVSAGVDVDREKGVVILRRPPTDRPLWLRVSYAAGFASDDGETYANVPGWLALAAQLTARVSLNAHPSFVTNLSTTDASMLQSQLDRIVQSKMRYLPWAQVPGTSRII